MARFAREIALRVPSGERAPRRLFDRLRPAALLRRGSAPYAERVLAALEALS